MSELVSWCVHVIDSDVLVDLILIDREVEVALCSNISESIGSKTINFFLRYLVLEARKS